MNPNEEYFRRLTGDWNWVANFQIISWKNLLTSKLQLIHKIRVVAMIISQSLIGHYLMWTRVRFTEGSEKVFHSMKLTKWGIVFYHSEKIFVLDKNGTDLQLQGEEAYWPLTKTFSKFENTYGKIESSATSASYQMPLFGVTFACQTFLRTDQGWIELDAGWMKARFDLKQIPKN